MYIQEHEFIHSPSKYILTYYVPDIVSGAGDTTVNKIDANSCPHEPYILEVGRQTNKLNTTSMLKAS